MNLFDSRPSRRNPDGGSFVVCYLVGYGIYALVGWLFGK